MVSTDKDGMACYFLVAGEVGHAFIIHDDLHLKDNIRRLFPVVKENSDPRKVASEKSGEVKNKIQDSKKDDAQANAVYGPFHVEETLVPGRGCDAAADGHEDASPGGDCPCPAI
jgi:hypothetical protein